MSPRTSTAWCAVVLATALAQPATAESLAEALAQAYVSNPTLLAERASLRAADEGVAQANAAWKPSLAASGSVTRSNSASTRSVNTTPTSVALSVSQILYRGGRSGIDLAETQVMAARAGLVGTEQQVLGSVVDAYMNVLRDQALVQLNRSSEQVLRNELEATRDRFQLGDATRTDIAQSQARLAAAGAARIQAQGALQSSIASYHRVVGAAPTEMATPQPLAGLPDSVEQAVALALDRNPGVVAAALELQAADLSVKAATGALLPTVSVSARTTRSADWAALGVDSYVSSIGLSVSVPLYQSGAQHSAIRKAKQSSSQARVEIEQARRTVQTQVAQAWYQLATARAAILSRSEQVRASQVAVDGVRQEEAVGSRTRLDVLNAEQELLNARVSLVTARRDEVVASYGLLSAMGLLNAAGLGLPVSVYDPKTNYRVVQNQWFGLNP